MKRSEGVSAGSLDMLLDTMCNTFGGVCFIALLIAIISASLPKDSSENQEEEVVQMAIDEKVDSLSVQRDELVQALKVQKELLANASENVASQAELDSVRRILEDTQQLEALKRERLKLEEEIKKLATKKNYNEREAERLRKLRETLKEQLTSKQYAKKRVVRTPQERELEGYQPITVWLIKGRMYQLSNADEVHCKETSEMSWTYTPIKGRGALITERYLSSYVFKSWLSNCHGKRFVRIFTDAESFSELRMLLDVVIEKKLQYNWRWHEGESIDFVSGNDGQVQ